MKLSTDGLWNLSKKHLKILITLEKLGEKHNFISEEIVQKRVYSRNDLNDLIKLQFITYRNGHYKLSISGTDAIAINELKRKGLTYFDPSCCGIGKESDIRIGEYEGMKCIIKMYRLGRTCYKNNLLAEGKDWYKLNKERSEKEAANLMKFINLPVPKVFAYNRHILLMEYLDYECLNRAELVDPIAVFNRIIGIFNEMYVMNYVHCDFNEFNILIKNDDVKIIDFTKIIRTDEEEAEGFYMKGIKAIQIFFKKRFNLELEPAVIY
ncbi:hypothetical protein NUSPORA_00398 [Nucleospora cyclopteri]